MERLHYQELSFPVAQQKRNANTPVGVDIDTAVTDVCTPTLGQQGHGVPVEIPMVVVRDMWHTKKTFRIYGDLRKCVKELELAKYGVNVILIAER
jgi:hypothetical protein